MKNSNLLGKCGTAPSSAIKPDILSIVLKVTERCNLACPYCYFFFSGDETYKQHPPFIPKGTVGEVIRFIRQAIEAGGVRQVRIGLHGGEPLLLKISKFAELCEAFRSALDPLCELMLIVQTNGVLVTREWVELFSRFKIRVGVSIDGNEAVHNIFRITKKGAGTYAETRRGWNLLNQSMADGELPSANILCVISPQQSGAAIYKHFIQELKASGVNFLLPDMTHDSPEATERYIEGCGDFMIDVFKAWSEYGGRKGFGTVRFIDEVIGPLMNDELCRRSALSKFEPLGQFVISSNGEVSPDDVIRGIAPRFRGLNYNVASHQCQELQESSVWQELENARRSLPSACRECVWKSICGGGAYQHRYSEENGFDNPSVYCSALKRFYGHVTKQVVAAGYPIEEIERRLELAWN
ncbi:radical SAM/SPASM domain-containing protein [Janthinobacterium fluminis]|uniref:Radical SAM protein n=1 Tax=Janthinobacterium fluminis TaxID=2987524 RepID=A0ABT5K0U1_9BURK|nr:radical SAM protein [Janthinobacterium fluminis]MDC8758316.1 radical SAM protein [Janthinobacterium fluminis]